NAAPLPRDMELRYQVEIEALRRLHGASLGVVGREDVPLAEQGVLHLPAMQPGENRWVGVRFPAAAGDVGQVLTVNFFEMSGGVVVNGFAMGARLGTMHAVVVEKLHQARSVFGRIGAGWRLGEAEELAALAAGHIEAKRHEEKEVLDYLHKIMPAIDRTLKQLVETHGRMDVFSLLRGVRNLEAAIGSGDAGVAAVALSCLLNGTDSWLTMLQLQHGDVADVLLNVRWQRAL